MKTVSPAQPHTSTPNHLHDGHKYASHKTDKRIRKHLAFMSNQHTPTPARIPAPQTQTPQQHSPNTTQFHTPPQKSLSKTKTQPHGPHPPLLPPNHKPSEPRSITTIEDQQNSDPTGDAMDQTNQSSNPTNERRAKPMGRRRDKTNHAPLRKPQV